MSVAALKKVDLPDDGFATIPICMVSTKLIFARFFIGRGNSVFVKAVALVGCFVHFLPKLAVKPNRFFNAWCLIQSVFVNGRTVDGCIFSKKLGRIRG